jgi:hypothetical protein
MANTIQALKRFQRAVQTHGVDQIRVVATSAMRDARNGAAFQAWVKAETGWTMEIISGLEEGRLIHLGLMAAAGSSADGASCRSAPGWTGAAGGPGRGKLRDHAFRKEAHQGDHQHSARCGAAHAGVSLGRSGAGGGPGTDAAVDSAGVAAGAQKDQTGRCVVDDWDLRNGRGAE